MSVTIVNIALNRTVFEKNKTVTNVTMKSPLKVVLEVQEWVL